jgi:hypothetical protein
MWTWFRDSAFAPPRCAAWLAAAGPLVLGATAAHAHGFGQRYDLPLPFAYYLFGTAATVVVSFVVVALFLGGPPRARAGRRRDLLAAPLGRLAARLVDPLRVVVLALFAVAILAGFAGNQSPYRNILPTLVWIVFWVGFAFLSAMAGNLWALINPWRTLFEAADRAWRRLFGRTLSLARPYPAVLGVWPAVLLLLAFAWIELVDPRAAEPAHLASLAIAYSALTWAGMVVFGAAAWLRHGEVFSVVFGLLARFAPVEMERTERTCVWRLRAFGTGIVESPPASPSMTALVLLLLSTVLFDGLLGTPEWGRVEAASLEMLPGLGENRALVVRTAGLVAFWLIFYVLYLGVSLLMRAAAGGTRSASAVGREFVGTLVPIAIGYHVAHYLAFLLIQGQYVIPLISDPFGHGWDLFGTAGYRVDIAVVGARFEWYTAVAAILIGHVAAVHFAHARALAFFRRRAPALRSQVPLTALMVVYTFVSLSILAQPLVREDTPATPVSVSSTIGVPADAVIPEAGTGRLQPVGQGRSARAKLTYRVLGSAFHDGTKTEAADLLYAYGFAYRWSARRNGEDASYDPAVEAATVSLRRHLVALRIAGTDATSRTFRVGDVSFVRELIAVDVYVDVVTGRPDTEAIVAPPWSTLPWHLVVLMEEAIVRGWAAFSQDEASRRGVPWLDLVRSAELNRKLAALAAGFERSGHRPESLRAVVSEGAARKRWAAIGAFYKAHNHFLVTNGPYRVKQWSPGRVTLEAFRDLTYPLGVGSYDTYAIPRRGFVTGIEWDGATARVFGEIELIEKFQRSYRLVRTPLKSVQPVVRQRAAPECRYVVIDGGRRVVASGRARLGEDATFRLDFRNRLPQGRYTLLASIVVNDNAMNADIRRVEFSVGAR